MTSLLQKVVNRLQPPSPEDKAQSRLAWEEYDKKRTRRTGNLSLIPAEKDRKGGKVAYGEWAHVIGIFQALIGQSLPTLEQPQILDIGSGTGIMGIAAAPFLTLGGRYTGIDVNRADIDFCRGHFPEERFRFIHHEAHNEYYAREQAEGNLPWAIDDASVDLVTALSVWTHLLEADARFYLREIDRVLRPGGKAILTFFIKDGTYRRGLEGRDETRSTFHHSPRNMWIFEEPVKGSTEWFMPKWAKMPEEAIAVTEKGLAQLIADTRLRRAAYYPGNWKEAPGIYFQDIMIYTKTAA